MANCKRMRAPQASAFKRMATAFAALVVAGACSFDAAAQVGGGAGSPTTVSWRFGSGAIGVGQSIRSTMDLRFGGVVRQALRLNFSIPRNFAIAGFSSPCGGSLVMTNTSDRAQTYAINNVSGVPGGSCSISFVLTAPKLSRTVNGPRIDFSLVPVSLSAGTAVSLTGIDPLRYIGMTPGLYSGATVLTSMRYMDFFMTPGSDPGPSSNVFWSNQIDSLGGYTGMQSTALPDGPEGSGKNFLFSTWGGTDARAGTPAGSGPGGGSFCTVSSTAADGEKGVQCRYRYDWQVGHTYRFRVQPEPAIGAGWFSSTVTDVTPGATPVTFRIGNIKVSNATATLIPRTSFSQWVEYWEWNSWRTDCISVPRTAMTVRVEGYDGLGNRIPISAPATGTACELSSVSNRQNGTLLAAATNATSRGFLKSQSGLCLAAGLGAFWDKVVDVKLLMQACPDRVMVQKNGGGAYANMLWVISRRRKLVLANTSCIAAFGTNVFLEDCDDADTTQNWSFSDGKIIQENTQSCLDEVLGGLKLVPCFAVNGRWSWPTDSFTY